MKSFGLRNYIYRDGRQELQYRFMTDSGVWSRWATVQTVKEWNGEHPKDFMGKSWRDTGESCPKCGDPIIINRTHPTGECSGIDCDYVKSAKIDLEPSKESGQ